MTKNNENKSLFLYTSLIFIVAILLIIIAFFGQTNVQKNQPKVDEPTEEVQTTSQPAGGITERVSVLSEDNRVLLAEKTELEEKLQTKNEEIDNLKTDKMSLESKIAQNDLLLQAYGYMSVGNDAKALEALNKLDVSALSSDGQILYNSIKNNIQ